MQLAKQRRSQKLETPNPKARGNARTLGQPESKLVKARKHAGISRNPATQRITGEDEFMGEVVPTDPEELGELEAMIAQGTAIGDPCLGFGMYCNPEEPEWFAVKVSLTPTCSCSYDPPNPPLGTLALYLQFHTA